MAASPLPLWGKPALLSPCRPDPSGTPGGSSTPSPRPRTTSLSSHLLCLRYARPVGMSRCLPVPVLVLDGTDSPLGVQRGEAARALVPARRSKHRARLVAPGCLPTSQRLRYTTRMPPPRPGGGSCRSRGKRQAASRRTLENRRTGFPQLPQPRRLRRSLPHRGQNPSHKGTGARVFRPASGEAAKRRRPEKVAAGEAGDDFEAASAAAGRKTRSPS